MFLIHNRGAPISASCLFNAEATIVIVHVIVTEMCKQDAQIVDAP